MQLDLFDVLYENFMFDKDKPIRVVELFSGIGFQSMGMELAEVPYEVVAISEIDKFAILVYASIHTDYLKIRDDYDFQLSKEEMVDILQRKNVGYNFSSGRHSITKSTNIETVKDYFLADKLSNNLGDISLIKGSYFPKDIDVMTYSFPCTDLSKAGQQAGLGKGTRSGLIYEVLRILQELKEINNLPKVPIMENVVDLVQSKFVKQWQGIQQEIEKIGYVNYQQTLNAKQYGIAQNRNRVFMVSILGDYNYNFPKGFELEHRLKDYLEDEVDDKYYLSDRALNGMINTTFNSSTLAARTEKDGVISTLCARNYKDPKLVVEPMIVASRGRNPNNPSDRKVGSPTKQRLEPNSQGLCNTLTTVQKDNYVIIPEATEKGYAEAYDGDGVYINRPHQKRGVVQKGLIQTLKTSGNDVGVVVMDDAKAVAQRGRYNEDGEIEQQFEVGSDVSNALTTVQKDMMVVRDEPVIMDSAYPGSREPRIYKDTAPTLTTKSGSLEVIEPNAKRQLTNAMLESGNFEPYDMVRHSYTENRMNDLERKEGENNIGSTLSTRPDTLGVVEPRENHLRIRKLTPTETGRLMGMQDYQINKQNQVSSNAQMYKQHGNGIVAQVIGLIIGMAYYDNEIELREKVMANSHMWIKEKERKC